MIAVAGYINYRDLVSKNNKDAKVSNVSLNLGETDAQTGDLLSNDAEPDDFSVTDPGATVLTGGTTGSSTGTSTKQSDFIISAKLDREQVRAANKESLLDIINNTALDETSKSEAVSRMIALTDIAEREAAAELLLEAKGFTDVIVSITDEQADVVVYRASLSDTERAQIEDIIKRKSGVSVENITISAVSSAADSAETSAGAENETESENETYGEGQPVS